MTPHNLFAQEIQRGQESKRLAKLLTTPLSKKASITVVALALMGATGTAGFYRPGDFGSLAAAFLGRDPGLAQVTYYHRVSIHTLSADSERRK